MDRKLRDLTSMSDQSFRRELIAQGAVASLIRFDHPQGAPVEDSEEEAARAFQINVVERGWFRLGFRGRDATLGASAVFLSRPGDVYRYAHLHAAEPDVCLSLNFSDAMADDLAGALEPLPIVAPPTNRLAYLGLRLTNRQLASDAMRLDELATDFLEATTEAAIERRKPIRPDRLHVYAKRVDLAREVIDARPDAAISLPILARAVGMSMFSFARLFRELVGVPPHAYLVRARLRRACDLLEGGMSVTDACYASGFNSLSHFINTFRARCRVTPSAFRAMAANGRAAVRRRLS
jgi:AraC-like DNA-binding protein